MESTFSSFNATTFAQNTMDQLAATRHAIQRKNKFELYNNCSKPLSDFVMECLESNYPLPFDHQFDFSSVEIIKIAKYVSDNDVQTSSRTWYQLQLLFRSSKHPNFLKAVTERRECDLEENSWRFSDFSTDNIPIK